MPSVSIFTGLKNTNYVVFLSGTTDSMLQVVTGNSHRVNGLKLIDQLIIHNYARKYNLKALDLTFIYYNDYKRVQFLSVSRKIM